MKESFVMTVYNRPEVMLVNTLSALARCNMADCEVIVVNDGSDVDYGKLWDLFGDVMSLKVVDHGGDTSDPLGDEHYSIDGYNNPSAAFNVGIDAADGDYLWLMSSDIIVQPPGVESMRKRNRDNAAVFCRVVNMDNGMEYLGPSRLFPMHWLVTSHRDNMPRFDEEFMQGIDFEDNDFAGQLALKTEKLICDWDITAFHQSHPATAYTDNLKGHHINKAHIINKWGGIPFDNTASDPIRKKVTEVAGTWIVKCEPKGSAQLQRNYIVHPGMEADAKKALGEA